MATRTEPIGTEFDGVLAAARTGAEWAWRKLYQSVAPAVLGYLRAQRAPEHEDLTAEVFVQVVRSLGSFDGDEPAFRSWVLVIAHRKLIDDSRYRRRRPSEPAATETIEANCPFGNVEEDALSGLSRQEVGRLLGELTPEQRDVLLLRILGDLTVPEVARAMSKRPGAIEALQRRALSRLRKKLTPSTR